MPKVVLVKSDRRAFFSSNKEPFFSSSATMKIWWVFSVKWEESCVFVDSHGPHGELEGAAVRGVRWAAEAPETHTARM